MAPAPRICVLIPVFNHGLTVGRVVAESQRFFPVIVVNDGSTDQTGEVLRRQSGITLVEWSSNRGKAAALKAGFARAEELGYTHAITLDADGQHPTDSIEAFAAACRREPESLILGVRDLETAGAPLPRRLTNDLSNFWFRFETGQRLKDTQCGFRVYPLERIRPLPVRSGRYAFELEILVKAAWAGIPLSPQPVGADYAAPTSRMSHFEPGRDFYQISVVHCRLSIQAFCLPSPLRRLAASGRLRSLPRERRWRTVLKLLYTEHTGSPARLAWAVGVGLFCGIAPIWGAQSFAAAALAHELRLNKAIALTASQVSFPLAAPFILAAGLVFGHYLWTGNLLRLDARQAAGQIPAYFCQWFVGSLLLGIVVGLLGAAVTYVIAQLARAWGKAGSKD